MIYSRTIRHGACFLVASLSSETVHGTRYGATISHVLTGSCPVKSRIPMKRVAFQTGRVERLDKEALGGNEETHRTRTWRLVALAASTSMALFSFAGLHSTAQCPPLFVPREAYVFSRNGTRSGENGEMVNLVREVWNYRYFFNRLETFQTKLFFVISLPRWTKENFCKKNLQYFLFTLTIYLGKYLQNDNSDCWFHSMQLWCNNNNRKRIKEKESMQKYRSN